MSMIEIEHLTKTFPGANAVTALDDVSLNIESGEIFGIIGLSGAGKSTLVRCMNLLERPTSGVVRANGAELTGLADRNLRKARQSIGMIFQGFNLLMQRTALDNVCFPLELGGMSRSEARKKARPFLELVGLEDRENAYPTQLSGGQKQRVAIARAMVNSPALLLADEPTGALDTKSGEQVMEIFENLNSEGVTIVMITHEKEIAEHAKRIMYIRDGELSESSGGDSL